MKKQIVTYMGAPVRQSTAFSTETLTARRDWQEVFKVMKSKDLQPRLIFSAKLSFKIKELIKRFPDRKKLKQFITSKEVVDEMLKGILSKRKKKIQENEQ